MTAARRPSPTRRPPPRRAGWVIPAVFAVIAIAAIVAVLAVASGDGGEDRDDEIAESVTVEGSPLPAPGPSTDDAIGEPAPALSGTSPTGEPVEIAPGDGEPRAIVFVAHWCPHCQAEVPRIVALADAGGTDGVALDAVATATTAQRDNYPPSAWLEREGWPFPVLADDADQTAARAYGLTAFPYFVFVDGEGIVVGRASGELGADTLQAAFAALAAGEPLPTVVAGSFSSSS